MRNRFWNRIQVRFVPGLWATVLFTLLLALGACQQPELLQNELPDDGPPIATSPAQARRFVEKVTAAGESAATTKRLELAITQAEVTSFLNISAELAEQMRAMNARTLDELQQMQASPELQGSESLQGWLSFLQAQEGASRFGLSDLSLRVGIQEPQVYFKGNGHIIIRGYAELLGQRQPLRLVLAPQASQGELVLDFVEGKLGPLAVPEAIIDQIGTGLAKLILAGDELVKVSQIRVNDGTLTLSGGYRQ
jgi:hypothetical protein